MIPWVATHCWLAPFLVSRNLVELLDDVVCSNSLNSSSKVWPPACLLPRDCYYSEALQLSEPLSSFHERLCFHFFFLEYLLHLYLDELVSLSIHLLWRKSLDVLFAVLLMALLMTTRHERQRFECFASSNLHYRSSYQYVSPHQEPSGLASFVHRPNRLEWVG